MTQRMRLAADEEEEEGSEEDAGSHTCASSVEENEDHAVNVVSFLQAFNTK